MKQTGDPSAMDDQYVVASSLMWDAYRVVKRQRSGAQFDTIESALGLLKAPVPRFISVAIGVPFRIGQRKTKLLRVDRKPPERLGARKRHIQKGAIRGGYIDGAAGVMFAEPRRGAR